MISIFGFSLVVIALAILISHIVMHFKQRDLFALLKKDVRLGDEWVKLNSTFGSDSSLLFIPFKPHVREIIDSNPEYKYARDEWVKWMKITGVLWGTSIFLFILFKGSLS